MFPDNNNKTPLFSNSFNARQIDGNTIVKLETFSSIVDYESSLSYSLDPKPLLDSPLIDKPIEVRQSSPYLRDYYSYSTTILYMNLLLTRKLVPILFDSKL